MRERSKPRICLAVSDKPEGSFRGYRAPLFNYGWSAIDSHIFIDDQDKPYLYFAQVGISGDPNKGESASHPYGKSITRVWPPIPTYHPPQSSVRTLYRKTWGSALTAACSKRT